MTRVAIGELVTVRGGGTPRKSVAAFYDGGVPWVTPKDMKSRSISGSLISLTESGVASSPAKLIPANSVLVVVRSGVLKHTLPVGLTSVPVTVNQDMKALTPGPRLDANYLAYLIQARSTEVLSWVRATTADNFPIDKLLALEFDLPPIEEQRRIAAILDHAEALQRAAVTRIELIEASLTARFHCDFGDPGPDSSGTRPLRGVVPSIDNGRSPVCESRPRSDGEFGVLKLGAVTYGTYRPFENKAYLGSLLPTDREVRPGDLLMTRKNTKDLVGALAYVEDTPERLLLPDLVFRLNYDEAQVHPLFLQRLLMCRRMRDAVRGLASGSASSMPNISKARLLELSVPIPSITRQIAFVHAARQHTSQRVHAQNALKSFGGLFASLQARAFSGRL